MLGHNCCEHKEIFAFTQVRESESERAIIAPEADFHSGKKWNYSTQISSERKAPPASLSSGALRNFHASSYQGRNVKSLILRNAASKIRPNRAYELRKISSNVLSNQPNNATATFKKVN